MYIKRTLEPLKLHMIFSQYKKKMLFGNDNLFRYKEYITFFHCIELKCTFKIFPISDSSYLTLQKRMHKITRQQHARNTRWLKIISGHLKIVHIYLSKIICKVNYNINTNSHTCYGYCFSYILIRTFNC